MRERFHRLDRSLGNPLARIAIAVATAGMLYWTLQPPQNPIIIGLWAGLLGIDLIRLGESRERRNWTKPRGERPNPFEGRFPSASAATFARVDRSSPTSSSRTWPRGKPWPYDPKWEVLVPCYLCERKVGEGPLKAVRLWRVRVIHPHAETSWSLAVAICADGAECEGYRVSRRAKQREAAARRRPPLPHVGAGPGCCKWCGEEIAYVETASYQRRQRTLHRGDEWEMGDTDCRRPAFVWSDPRSAQNALLEAQGGRCRACDAQVGVLRPTPVWEVVKGVYAEVGVEDRWQLLTASEGGPSHGTAVDHITPLVDGGQNVIENLQVICQVPCHATKTGREARARARARKAVVSSSAPDQGGPRGRPRGRNGSRNCARRGSRS